MCPLGPLGGTLAAPWRHPGGTLVVPWWYLGGRRAVRVERCGVVMRGYAATWWVGLGVDMYDMYGCG